MECFLIKKSNKDNNKEKDLCLKEKIDLSICINSSENKDCIIYEKLYDNCLSLNKKSKLKSWWY